MRVFKTRLFAKWARKEKLNDSLLQQAIREIEDGLVEGNLGGNVYKKRIPLKGHGKRGGARSVIAYKVGDKAFFIFGYPKNEREDMTTEEKKIAKTFAHELLGYTPKQLNELLQQKKLIEVSYER